jgi:hypothetical protein
MTIYEIKRRTQNTSPHFFSHRTLKFFKQTLKSFKVTKLPDGKYLIRANAFYGVTSRIFNPITNELESNTQYSWIK